MNEQLGSDKMPSSLSCYRVLLTWCVLVIYHVPHHCNAAGDQEVATAVVHDLRGGIVRAPLPGFPVLEIDLRFRGANDEHLVHFAGFTHLRYADISGTKVTKRGLAILAGLPSLEELHADELNLRDDDLGSLQTATRLRRLSLAGNPAITGHGFVGLDMPELEYLDLSRCGDKQLSLGHLPRVCPKLKRLWLQVNGMCEQSCRDVARIKTLRELTLHGSLRSDRQLALLAGLSRLQELYISQCDISDAGLAAITGDDLRALDIQQTNVSGKGLSRFARLETLAVGGPMVSDDSLREIAYLAALSQLDIDASQCKLTGQGFRELARASSLRQLSIYRARILPGDLPPFEVLEKLELMGCELAAGVFEDLTAFKELRSLELRNCSLKGTDIAVIRSIPNLRELHLFECTGLTNESVPALEQLERLEAIYTDFNGIGKSQEARLRAKMTNLSPRG